MKFNDEQLEKDTKQKLLEAKKSIEKAYEILGSAVADTVENSNIQNEICNVRNNVLMHKDDIYKIEMWLAKKIDDLRQGKIENDSVVSAFRDGFFYKWNSIKGKETQKKETAELKNKEKIGASINKMSAANFQPINGLTLEDNEEKNNEINSEIIKKRTMARTVGAGLAVWVHNAKNMVEEKATVDLNKLKKLLGITQPQAIPETTTPDNTQINQDIGNNQTTNSEINETKTTDNTQINQDIGNNSTPNNGIGGNSTQPTTPEQPSVTIPEVITPDPIPTPEPTISEKIQLSKEKMVKYFNEHEDYGISEEKINEVFSNILIASSDEEFEKMAEKYGYSNCENINAITYNNGEIIILRPGANQEDIIKEAVYSLGSLEAKKDRIAGSLSEDIKEDTGDQNATLKESNDSRGINMAAAEKISYEILEKTDLSDASDNCKALQEMDEQLGKIGEEDIVNRAFFNEIENPFAVKLNEVTENEDTYKDLVESMEITDEFGTEKDEQKIQKAKLRIESIQNVLELKVNAKLS